MVSELPQLFHTFINYAKCSKSIASARLFEEELKCILVEKLYDASS